MSIEDQTHNQLNPADDWLAHHILDDDGGPVQEGAQGIDIIHKTQLTAQAGNLAVDNTVVEKPYADIHDVARFEGEGGRVVLN